MSTNSSEGVDYDLIVLGGSASGVSAAKAASDEGLLRARILVEPNARLAFAGFASKYKAEIGYGETLTGIDLEDGGEALLVSTDQRTYRTREAQVSLCDIDLDWKPPIVPPESDKVMIDVLPETTRDSDILVVGNTDHAVELVADASAAGARVVLAAGGMNPLHLAPAAHSVLRELERERKVTVLYRSVPDDVWAEGEFPLAIFNDRRTPDLEFDAIVFASHRRSRPLFDLNISSRAMDSGKVCFVDDELANSVAISPMVAAAPHIEELREEHYNATIVAFEKRHSDLWVLRVRPDQGNTSHLPGQYASLGLGYWEDRIDRFSDVGIEQKRHKLIRRSYSISHAMFDPAGYLAKPDTEELEFYVVLVPASGDHVSALTPRLANKEVGDRIYLGPKVAGRYTLNAVESPEAAVVFFATGTGEAPHNSMIVELLRKGHTGPIVSAVTVRRWQDLGYLEAHRRLEERFENYHYLPAPTREPDVAKRYLQDLIRDGDVEKKLGQSISPTNTHAYLCGNPAMIGLPEEEDGLLVFPETTGVIELLVERGLRINRRNDPGTIHFEEYW